MSVKPPLELTVELTDASGRMTRWDGNARNAGNIPTGIGFGTKRGDGFADGPSIDLQRRIDRDWPDINLFDDVKLIGADGSIAYEGYISANPRTFDGGHTTSIRVAGPMTRAQARPFSEAYIDRDLSQWIGPSNARQIAVLSANFTPGSPVQQSDPSGDAALYTAIVGTWTAASRPSIEATYIAMPGVTLGRLYYEWEKDAGIDIADTNWQWTAALSDDDVYSSTDGTGNLLAAGPGSGTLDATTSTRRVAAVTFGYLAGPAGTDNLSSGVYWRNLAAIGNHGLTLQPSTTPGPGGLLVSDMIIDICRRFVPKLDPSGVQATDYPVDQAAFSQSQPYDAWLSLNKYHLWELAVWENNQLCYYPADLADYDWQVRLDDDGVTVDLPGDSTETLANGISVTYLDVTTGLTGVLDPSNTPALADPNPLNLATLHGEQLWTPLDLSSLPLSAADATQVGIAALAQYNQAKAAGTIKITGHIRDRAGHWQPGWKVRATDTIAIVNHPDDRPRLIGETSWDQDALTNTIAVDNTLTTVDAFIDRATTALTAAGLSTFPT